MILDRKFKSLNHSFSGYECFTNGKEVEDGYKPDYVLKKGNKFIILESENTSSRKTYIGGLIKAAHFLQNEKSGVLIFVMQPKENTTAFSISKQLGIYFKWVKAITNLKEIYVIEASQYCPDEKAISIDSTKFRKLALKV